MELNPLPTREHTRAPKTLSLAPQTRGTIRNKFQTIVRRVIQKNRACATIRAVRDESEQGIDPRSVNSDRRFGSRRAECTIEVIRYSKTRCRTTNFDNAGFISWMNSDFSKRRPDEIRWINIGGVSWDVVKALAIHFELHPLSIEDIMAGTRDKSFKVDYYPQHLFAQLTSYKLRNEIDKDAIAKVDKPPTGPSRAFHFVGRAKTHHQPSSNLPTIQLPSQENQLPPISRPKSLKSQSSSISELGRSALAVVQHTTYASYTQSADESAIHALKLQSGTLDVEWTRVFVFLLKDGTLLSIHREPTLYGTELKKRLDDGSLIRDMQDASMLFHGFLDLVVDHLIHVCDGYQLAISALERSVLLKPTLATLQTLHLLSGDIELLRMSVKPLQRLIYGLRRYDRERYKGLSISQYRTADVKGFLSEETKVYLTDVYDHVRYVMLSLQAQNSTVQELVSFTFHLKSCDSNNVMRRLLICTVIFLPMTAIVQYFGMNFATMDSVNLHSDALFWKVAGPVLLTLILVALRNRLLKAVIPGI